MRVDNALRMAGGPGRVTHAERIGLRELGPRLDRARRLEQRLVLRQPIGHHGLGGVPHDHDVFHARDLVADAGEHRIDARVGEDHRVARVIDDVGQILRGEPEVQRVQHGARERGRPVDLEMAVTVPRERRHAVAFFHSEIAEEPGQAHRALGEVGVGVPEERASRHPRRQRLLREQAAAPLEEMRQRERSIHHQVVQWRAHGARPPGSGRHATP